LQAANSLACGGTSNKKSQRLLVSGRPRRGIGLDWSAITEFGVVANYFFHDHGNKVTADLTWVQDNSAVNSTSSGYLVNPSKGVVVEDGIMLRLQWQISF